MLSELDKKDDQYPLKEGAIKSINQLVIGAANAKYSMYSYLPM